MPSSTPGGMLTDKVFSRRTRPWPPQALARLLDDPAGALAGGAGPLDRKKPLLRANAPAAVASRAGDRFGAGLGAAAVALVAGDQIGDADRRLLAAKTLLERNFEVVAQIAAAARPSLAAPAVAHKLAEHLVEDVGKSAGKAKIAGAAPAALLKGGMAKPVIGSALLIVLQDVVGLVEVFEFLFCALVAGIPVRVILHRELAIGPLEIVGAGGFGDAENLVKILLSHARWAFAGGVSRRESPRREAPG